MHALSGRHPRSGQPEIVRNPVTCVAVAAAVAFTFWAGLIWLAERLYG
jgi:hypothetical protein